MSKKQQQKKQTAFDKLNDKHKAFLMEYMIDKNATRAYMRAYGCKETTAAVSASRLLRTPKMAQALDEKHEKIWKEKKKDRGLIYDELMALGTAKLTDYVEVDETGNLQLKDLTKLDGRSLKSLQIKRKTIQKSKDSNEVETEQSFSLSIHDKEKALTDAGKILGIVQDRKIHEGPGGGPIQFIVEPETREILNEW